MHTCVGFGWWASNMCYSTWGWTTFTSRGYDFLYFRGSIWEVISHVTRFLPLLLSFGRRVVVWGTSTFSGTLVICIMWFSDNFVTSKCMWHGLQWVANIWLNFLFIFLSTWIWGLNVDDILNLSALFVVLISPLMPKCPYFKCSQRTGCKLFPW